MPWLLFLPALALLALSWLARGRRLGNRLLADGPFPDLQGRLIRRQSRKTRAALAAATALLR